MHQADDSESSTDRTRETVCKCKTVKTAAVEGLLLCTVCDHATLKQAGVSVQGRIKNRESCPCAMCLKAAG